MDAAGSIAAQVVHYASLAILAAMANAVACVFADTRPDGGGAHGGVRKLTCIHGLSAACGFLGANAGYGPAARRHM